MKYHKFETYYNLRATQFAALTDANDWFLDNEEQRMWDELFHYADASYEAKKLFDTFEAEDIEVLLDGRVPMFMLEVTYDDIETS
jgi:S-adenosylmethionine:diacylglycerol 3-amino-3-carboxypropyl transferase